MCGLIFFGIVLLGFLMWYCIIAFHFPMMVIPLGVSVVVTIITAIIAAGLRSDSRRERLKASIKRKSASEIERARQLDKEVEEENKRIIEKNKHRRRQRREDEEAARHKYIAETKDHLEDLQRRLAECERRIKENDIIGEDYKNDEVINYLIKNLEDNLIGSAREGLNRYKYELRIEAEWKLKQWQEEFERKQREKREYEQLLADARTWDKQNEIIRNQKRIIKDLEDRK